MGMLPAGMLGAFVAGWLGLHRVSQLDIRFVSQVWPGEVLELAASDVFADGAGGRATLTASASGGARLTGAVAFDGATVDRAAPPTFTHVVAHWAGGDAIAVPREIGLDIARLLHAEQRYTLHRPVLAGEVLRGERKVTSAYLKRSRSGADMVFATVSTRFTDEAGAPVVDEDQLLIERQRAEPACGAAQAASSRP